MNYCKKDWNEDFKKMKALLKRRETFDMAIEKMLFLHGMVHGSEVSNADKPTFEDLLWHDLSENVFREAVNSKKRTIAYGIWHATRIEDMTLNLLIAGTEQVIDQGEWQAKIHSSIYSTGNELKPKDILEFSSKIDMGALIAYRNSVGKRSREIIKNMDFDSLKRKVSQEGIRTIIDSGAVSKDQDAFWLIDYWKDKDSEGILLMPATRHNLVHLNECFKAKDKGKSL